MKTFFQMYSLFFRNLSRNVFWVSSLQREKKKYCCLKTTFLLYASKNALSVNQVKKVTVSGKKSASFVQRDTDLTAE